jgi:hypothetical protein
MKRRLAVIVVLMLALLPRSVSYADTGCSASISPTSAVPTSNGTYTVSVTNNGSTDVQWIDITVSANFRYGGNYIYDWAGADHGDGATLTNNTLGQGQTANFDVAATAGLRTGADNTWVVQVSDDPGGANAVTCSGNLNVAISGHPPTSGAGGVSNVMVTNITTSSVTVTWDSDNATTALVYYGKTSDYDKTSGYNANMDTSHSVTLTGLSAGTAYHYQVAGDDGGGGFAFSDDNTFLTAAAPVNSGGGGGSGTGGSNGSGVGAGINGAPSETVAPTVAISGDFSKPFKAAPVINGTAADNVAVAKVEYSVDGGKNWVAVDKLTPGTTVAGKGKKKTTVTSNAQVTFQFTPILLEDGNFRVMARATDSSGNQATTAPVTVVIDRLPPRFGASLVTIGAQVVEPAENGALVLPAGEDFRMSVSMVGGTVTAGVRARLAGEPDRMFALTRLDGSGLWNGVLNFAKAGQYQLTGEAIDGAGNRESRVLATVQVMPPVQLVGNSGLAKKAVATLYYLNASDHSWKVWDAAAYGQKNPQPMNNKSALSLIVPAGTYYLKLVVPGAPDTLTRSFTVNRTTPLSGAVHLAEWARLKLGPVSIPLPWTSLERAPITPLASGAGSSAVGSRLPLVRLPTTSGGNVSPVDWYGKPTVLAAIATWAPNVSDELDELSKLRSNTDINVVVLAQQQQAETVAAYLDIAGRSLEGVADPDGLLSGTLTTPGIPVLYFVDRHGIIKKVMVGSRSANEILTNLSHL